MAVDGVVLREAIRAWVDATGTAREATAFDIAETVRWLEKGLSGFFHLANGTALLTLGLSIAVSGGYHRLIGVAGIVAGLGFLSGGYATAHTGFSPEAGSVLDHGAAATGAVRARHIDRDGASRGSERLSVASGPLTDHRAQGGDPTRAPSNGGRSTQAGRDHA